MNIEKYRLAASITEYLIISKSILGIIRNPHRISKSKKKNSQIGP